MISRGPDDIEAHLVFFSTFEELKLPATGPMDHATIKLYEPSPTPILYVGPCDLMLGRVPLFPLFLKGNTTPTIPHKFDTSRAARSNSEQPTQQLRMAVGGATCTRSSRGCGQTGRGKPRIGGLSVSLTQKNGSQSHSGLGHEQADSPAEAATHGPRSACPARPSRLRRG